MKTVSHSLVLMVLLWAISAIWLAGCSLNPAERDAAPASPTGSCTLTLGETAGDEEAIAAVLRAEGTLLVDQAIDPLMALWSPQGFVADAKYTPDDESDDQRWLGQDAIRHRYVRTVFPGAPSEASPADLQIEINGDSAVVNATTNIGDETAPAGDRWALKKVDGCWQILSLTYNLESKP
jgi:hypothetical protein